MDIFSDKFAQQIAETAISYIQRDVIYLRSDGVEGERVTPYQYEGLLSRLDRIVEQRAEGAADTAFYRSIAYSCRLMQWLHAEAEPRVVRSVLDAVFPDVNVVYELVCVGGENLFSLGRDIADQQPSEGDKTRGTIIPINGARGASGSPAAARPVHSGGRVIHVPFGAKTKPVEP